MSDGQPSGLLLAEANTDVAKALGLYLEQFPGLRLLAHVWCMQPLLLALAEQQPHLLLLDWNLPGFTHHTGLALLRAACPALYIIGMGSDVRAETTALVMGANAFVGKSESVGKLTHVLTQAIAHVTQANFTSVLKALA